MNNLSFLKVKIKTVLPQYLPKKAHPTDGAYDLYARVTEPVELLPGETMAIPVGISLGLEYPFIARILPRSGLAAKYGVTVLNTPGLIDSGYRGEIQVILHNTGKSSFFISDGTRIAQMSFDTVIPTEFDMVDSLDETVRNNNGLGSTGIG